MMLLQQHDRALHVYKPKFVANINKKNAQNLHAHSGYTVRNCLYKFVDKKFVVNVGTRLLERHTARFKSERDTRWHLI